MNHPQIKTLQIVGDSSYGGATYLILEWCKYLVTQGAWVDVLSTDGQTIDRLSRIQGVHTIDQIYIPRAISPGADMRAFYRLVNLIRRERYDVVHTYTATPGFLGRVAARLAGVPVILHHQAGWSVTPSSSSWEKIIFPSLEILAILTSTKSICVGEAVARQARRYRLVPTNRWITIRNGIDPRPFMNGINPDLRKAFREEVGAGEKCILIGAAGRLYTQKDPATLIQALQYLEPRLGGREVMLLIAGDGPDRDEMEKLTSRLDLCDRVRFLGFYENIPRFLAGVDIFASSSLWEGLSISLLEAMAAAKPIVATSIEPNAELIEHERHGLLVPPRAPQDMASAICRFIHDPDFAQQCAHSAQQKMLSQYTLGRMLDETWELYQQLIES